ncbi:response regulator [Hydrocarboniphaga sp.]|uniref:response regulator n=1 Tax=Hydrocarboniphaga sp. TaxID=2033016 RepID=UPI003D0F54A8
MLVVDDHESTREMLRIALGIHGFQVETAENGVEALAVLAGTRCHVVLTDYWMPEMNGVELLQAMRRDDDLADIPVVIMTAAHDSLPPLAGGADALLHKPFDSDSLIRVLEQVDCLPH